MLGARSTHGQGHLAAVELGEIAPGIRGGQGAHRYYRLPLGGILIRLGIACVGGYPDRRGRLDGGFGGRHGRDDEARRQRRRGRRGVGGRDGAAMRERGGEGFMRVLSATTINRIGLSRMTWETGNGRKKAEGGILDR